MCAQVCKSLSCKSLYFASLQVSFLQVSSCKSLFRKSASLFPASLYFASLQVSSCKSLPASLFLQVSISQVCKSLPASLYFASLQVSSCKSLYFASLSSLFSLLLHAPSYRDTRLCLRLLAAPWKSTLHYPHLTVASYRVSSSTKL
ncbi:hypothetical protein K439DRAFT_1626061 [Ramaria rubella]|nr:hypothetical protein K439DRAFT_1626061 [Ramaria rubella]